MDNKIKMAVLEHLKGLMDSKMAEDIPSKMKVDEVHKIAPPDTVALGEDKHGNPMGMMEHEEGEEMMGHEPMSELPDLKELHSGTDKAEHPLFAMKDKKEEDPELGNNSFVANLKRAKKIKE